MHNGSCLCGAVKYQIDAPIESATHCHCGQCRKGHSAAFASYGNVRREHFRFTAGQDQVAAFHSSPHVTRTFCRQCGSNLQWFADHPHPKWVSVALGTLDSPLGEVPQKHIYTESKADWYAIADGLPQESHS
ncbi:MULTISPECIES: GFA family protein [Pseudomonas]|uniref:GFA family protein n=1 Tax=Pseudomonadaceae TaxID=135621 RepID=UPI00084AA9DF|nr:MULTISPECIES: GFA family protein [Pseudomonas]OEC49822.1 ribulose phosphate epimerase [Pseudomonas sp. ENNP23]